MKKKNIFLTLMFLLIIEVKATENKAAVDLSDTFFIDGSKITILGEIRDHVICDSEFHLPSMEGKKPTPDDLIDEELIYQDAQKHKVPLEEQAERHEAKIVEMYKIPEGQVASIYNKSGMTREEGFQKLCKMAANSIMPEIKIKQRLFVPHDAIEKYEKENPRFKQTNYELEIAFMPFLGTDPQKQKNQLAFLNEQIQNNSLDVMWTDPFWVKENDLENSKRFITELKVGHIAAPHKAAEGFELYRLKSKKEGRRIPLEKRLREITDKLREPKMVTMYSDYVESLRKDACIIRKNS